ncbi:MAG: hypothetical protein UX85_C0004G0015 [Candidatus Beckwithbacteria bacterium GW2011_GWB1_47_15]|uniref:Uncharacterized protein n=1 Tax=Candidatus Beckwithbacteria bacterium GW2011_GWB1_47_15 TaxID=1618371 RepID=A0A0G1RUZ0_9BACT|nr:MAG: hypothetical protein UY43_C0001G0234 [Candidatus Beckwithbacteria bacterium GW2011_GWC1_49_16]KKU35419.1 MAG: hypothetical protein UX50_C0003G0015 [Candidatus Beckwithbacteria bacterium GW2011_GWA1_46_30]KKU61094.1 MAG: hypothetical protein UX85_C0004G0015 [Candidatus Beckwithbacteria bacterium GW2011_GWB1_47_15]KKU71933.1 MAG: hypothetical protein UX97_C0002G0015 [Candidatus Beckwithbacteria bacterium GW2011_GWA2_47_25]KKW02948.1 MAG: hypothetical protein UY37_C0009G0022 [Candidatus Be
MAPEIFYPDNDRVKELSFQPSQSYLGIDLKAEGGVDTEAIDDFGVEVGKHIAGTLTLKYVVVEDLMFVFSGNVQHLDFWNSAVKLTDLKIQAAGLLVLPDESNRFGLRMLRNEAPSMVGKNLFFERESKAYTEKVIIPGLGEGFLLSELGVL